LQYPAALGIGPGIGLGQRRQRQRAQNAVDLALVESGGGKPALQFAYAVLTVLGHRLAKKRARARADPTISVRPVVSVHAHRGGQHLLCDQRVVARKARPPPACEKAGNRPSVSVKAVLAPKPGDGPGQ
jgi:hypothetical protein